MTATEFPDLVSADDPLASLGLDLDAEIETIQKAAEAPPDDLTDVTVMRMGNGEFPDGPARDGEPLYLDFETIPDLGRMHLFNLDPLPTMPSIDGPEVLMPVDQFVSQGVKEIESWLAKHNPPAEWMDAVRAAEKALPKPRKGAMDAFDDHAKRIGSIESAEADRVKMLSVNPLYCSIACVSWAVGNNKPMSFYAGNDVLLERHLLSQLWRLIARHSPVIGYGVSFFDIPVLLARSMILGVHPAKILDRRKYGSRDIVDLCQSLFDGQKAIGLGKVCQSLGIKSALPEVDGSHVYGLWKEGNTSKIREYCEDDVALTQQLHKRLAGYFCV